MRDQPGAGAGPARVRPEAAVPYTVAAEHVVTPDGVLTPGWLRVDGGRITETGRGGAPGRPRFRGHWALPGFVDLHVHGGGGASFTEGGPDQARRAAAFHRAHGSTRIVASLVTAPVAELEGRLALLAGLAGEGVIHGIHLEGPFLSAARCGAQDPRYLIPPDLAVFARLHAAAAGRLSVITVAPELPGALDVIRAAAAAGVIAAAGHTDASAEVTAQAVTAGVSHATHLGNGMRPLGHRDPGPAGALLDRQVTCEVIADGVHLHDLTVRLVARAAGRENLVLITDAMAAAGMPDGRYRLGALGVTVAGGVARLDPGPGGIPGSIAGSTATMDQIVRRAVTEVGLPVPDVAAAAATTPARRLGLAAETGALRPGLAADLVLLDETYHLTAVIAAGSAVPA
ncbi:MAG TPA: N-acetylglucosamine-6-phosphate deacetylase [Trebonia sp.]